MYSLNVQTVLYQTIQFWVNTVSMSKTVQSGPGSYRNEVVLRIPQGTSITGTSPLDCLVLYPGHSLVGGGSYTSAEVESVYSTAPAKWAINQFISTPNNQYRSVSVTTADCHQNLQ